MLPEAVQREKFWMQWEFPVGETLNPSLWTSKDRYDQLWKRKGAVVLSCDHSSQPWLNTLQNLGEKSPEWDLKIVERASQVAVVVKNLPANAGDIRDAGLIPELGRSPGRGHSNSLQYSCLENPMDRGAWRATVHRVINSWTQLKRLRWQGLTTDHF